MKSENSQNPYTIGHREAFEEYLRNEHFRTLIDSEHFVYVAECFVINHHDAVVRSDNVIELTEYAKTNMRQVAIQFNAQADAPGTGNHSENRAEDGNAYKYLHRYDPNAVNAKVFDRAAALRKAQAEFEDEYAVYQKEHATFSERVFELMGLRGWDSADFEKKTHLDAKTYSGIKHGNLPPPKLRKAVAICVGLSLALEQSKDLLALAGLALTGGREHRAYAYILTAFHGASISECNEILTHLGVKPLGIE